MTGMNFADAPGQNDFSELIPHGTLAWAIMRLRWYNFDMGIAETPSKSSDGKYLDMELTIEGGDWHGRKVWTRIGVVGSEKYVNMGRAAIRAILESGRNAHPTENPGGYMLNHYGDLDNGGQGLKVAVKIKVEPGTAKYPNDKNDVAVWLSPNPDGGTRKDWDRLMMGDTKPSANVSQPKARGGNTGGAPQSAGPSWAQQPAAQPPTQQPAPQAQAAPPPPPPNQGGTATGAAPGWLTNGQQQPQQPQQGRAAGGWAAPSTSGSLDDEIPF